MTAIVQHAAATALTAPWVERIHGVWQQSVKAVIETGRLIAEAKAALPRGEFGSMIDSQLPFCARTAQRLMSIAADERIRHGVSHLPAHWGTLYELTKLDDEQFESRIEDGTINPGMERKAISTLVKKAKREARERDLGGKQTALPQKKYGVVLADPEWSFQPYSRETGLDRAADNHYPTSKIEDILDRDVPSIAAPDCVLFLWATVPMIGQALSTLDAWGFTYKSHFIWYKSKAGTGYWNRNAHELLLIGTKGNIPAPAPGTQWPSVLEAPTGAHSAKPECFLDLIESYFPTLPKIELNRRGPARFGWDAWGNEAESEPLPPHDPDTGEPAPVPHPTPPGAGSVPDPFEIPAFLRRTAPSTQ